MFYLIYAAMRCGTLRVYFHENRVGAREPKDYRDLQNAELDNIYHSIGQGGFSGQVDTKGGSLEWELGSL